MPTFSGLTARNRPFASAAVKRTGGRRIASQLYPSEFLLDPTSWQTTPPWTVERRKSVMRYAPTDSMFDASVESHIPATFSRCMIAG
jgi:hypothetical protein